jgi:hypothetical protein
MDYSRDARFYPLFVCLVLINAWLFIRLMRRDSRSEATIYAVTFALLIYAHLYAAFFLGAEIIYAGREWFKGRNIRSFMFGALAGLVLIAPYFGLLMLDFSSRVNEQLGYIAIPHYAAPLVFYREASGSLMCPVILFSVVLALYTTTDSTTCLLLYWAVIPVVGVSCVSFLYPHRLVFTQRYLFAVLPAVLLLAAAGLWQLKAFSRYGFAVVLMYSAVVGGLSFRRVLYYKARNWGEIASTIEQKASADPVAVSGGSLNVLLYYLNSKRLPLIGLDCSGSPLRETPSMTSLWLIYTTNSICDATMLQNLLSSYQETERTAVGKDVALIHLTATPALASFTLITDR